MKPSEQPVAASFLPTFLKPEMWHIYRQITGLQQYRPVVFTHKRENTRQFPFPDDQIVQLPRPATRELRRFWCKNVTQLPVQIYRGEARRLSLSLDAAGASLAHIYFGHIGVYLLPLFDYWSKPVIVSFHGADAGVDMGSERVRDLYRQVFKKATLVLARSEALREDLIALGADPERTRLNRTSIPTNEFAFTERTAPADGAWHFVQAARLIPKKGLDVTMQVFADFGRNHPAARLTLAGDGPEREPLEKLAQELGVADRVNFVGFLSQDDLRALYGQAHIFLHPSRVAGDGDREGVPNSLLEAMACGLPILATHHGGIPEAVTSGRSGLLVPEDDVPGLQQALEAITNEPGKLQAFSRGARDEVTEKFSQAAQIAELERAYDWVLSRG